MIRTRYVAGTAAALATTLAALPFIGAPTASAADGTITAPAATLYAGDTVEFVVADGDAAGAYEVFLMKGTTKFATIGGGTEINGVEEVSWTIPTDLKTLIGTGYTVAVDPATGATFESASLAIAASGIATSMLTATGGGGDTTALTTVEQLVPAYAKWTSNGPTGGTVTLSLVKSGETKGTVLAKDTPNDGVEMVTIPTAKIAAGNFQLVVTPSYKTATAKTSTAFAVTAQNDLDISIDSTTIKLGRTQFVYVDMPYATTVKVEILDGAGKSIATLAKAYSYDDYDNGVDLPGYALTGAKLKAGTYKAVATSNQDKTVKAEVSFTVEAAAPAGITAGTAAALSYGVTQGQSVPLSIDTLNIEDGNLVSITITGGAKPVKVASKVQLVNGKATVLWLVDKKMTPGTAYKVEVTNDADTTVKSASSTFAVKANLTALYKAPAATTTTVAATTTTAAPPTT